MLGYFFRGHKSVLKKANSFLSARTKEHFFKKNSNDADVYDPSNISRNARDLLRIREYHFSSEKQVNSTKICIVF